jgi:hypothetical protein
MVQFLQCEALREWCYLVTDFFTERSYQQMIAPRRNQQKRSKKCQVVAENSEESGDGD